MCKVKHEPKQQKPYTPQPYTPQPYAPQPYAPQPYGAQPPQGPYGQGYTGPQSVGSILNLLGQLLSAMGTLSTGWNSFGGTTQRGY